MRIPLKNFTILLKKDNNFKRQNCRFELNLLTIGTFFKLIFLKYRKFVQKSTDLTESSSKSEKLNRQKSNLKFERSLLSRVGAFRGRNCQTQNAFSSFSRHFRLFLSLAQFVGQFSRFVRRFFHSIDSDDPVLGRVRFFDVFQFYIFVADFDVSDSIEAGHLRVSADVAKFVIRQFVHERVFHRFGHALVDRVLSLRAEKVLLFDVIRMLALGDSHHPQEFVYIVARITKQTAKNNQNVVDSEFLHDLVRVIFV